MLPIWLNAWPLPPHITGRQEVENWRITPVVEPLKDEVVGDVGHMLWVLMGDRAGVADRLRQRRQPDAGEVREPAPGVCGTGGAWCRTRTDRTGGAGREPGAFAHGRRPGRGACLRRSPWSCATAPTTLPRVADISLDPRVLGVCCGGRLLVSSLLFGAHSSAEARGAARPATRGAVRGASTSRERQRTRNSLVVVQVALALVLLVASGLMIRTFQALLSVEPGFSTRRVVQTAQGLGASPTGPRHRARNPSAARNPGQSRGVPGGDCRRFASSVPMEGRRV